MRQKKQDNIQMGERIKYAREHTVMTQEKLAERVGVSAQYISDLERGVVGIAIPTLRNLCISLGVSSDAILFGVEYKGRGDILAEKSKSLSDHQFLLLTEIVDKYVEALTTLD